jgi:hypothetical protein
MIDKSIVTKKNHFACWRLFWLTRLDIKLSLKTDFLLVSSFGNAKQSNFVVNMCSVKRNF